MALSGTGTDRREAASHRAVAEKVALKLAASEAPAAPCGTQAFWLAALSLGIFYILALAAWHMTGAVVPWDSKNHFYAMFRFLADALHHGGLPLWNPYHFGGHPSAADPQSLIFTPSMALFALIAPEASMQLFDAVILAHLLAGGFCILALFRRWRWHPAGALLCAMIFMLGGAASSRLQHTGIIISYSLFPLALLTLVILLDRPGWKAALAFGFSAALMALGRDQVAFLLCAVLAFYLIFAAAQSGRAPFYLWERRRALALSAAVILMVMAVPVLLTLQFLADSNRPGFPYGVAAVGSLAPVNLITLFAANFFGSLDRVYDYWGPDYDTMARPDWTDRAVDYLFIGALPFLLIGWHGLGAGRLFAKGVRFFALLLVLALIYALGRYTPLFAIAFDRIPGIALYRRPADATFVVNVALAFSAGYLLHLYVTEGLPRPFTALPRRVAGALAGGTALAILALIASGLWFSLREEQLAASLAALASAGLLAAAGAAILLGLEKCQKRALAASLFALLSGGEILWRNAASPLNAEPLDRYSIYSGMKPSEAAAIETLRQEITVAEQNGRRPRVEILGLKGPWQNASMVLKLEDTLGYNPLRIDAYDRAVGTGQDAEDFALRRYPDTFRGYNSRLASLLGLEYLMLDRPLAALPREIPRPRAQLIYASDGIYIYKLGKAAPRAYFASAVKPVDNEDVLGEHALPGFDMGREVLIDEASMGDLRGGLYAQSAPPQRIQTASLGAASLASKAARPDADDGPGGSRVSITSYENTRVELDVMAERPGIAVLHDLFYPGWEASVDGQKAPVLRANILFRGVEVPAGHHRVTFCFRPFSPANLAAAAASVFQRREE
jgi:hypothetical protein